ncbi:unnamed protein product [Lathyrus sativus]|nr:unnamed protein product [Lathyrus sativus]
MNRSRSTNATETVTTTTTTNPYHSVSDPCLSSHTELTEGRPSRNMVEIIFHTSWGPKSFSGRVEMIFKVHNGSRMVSRFEEYHEAVKTRSGSVNTGSDDNHEENARYIADGNEVMRFHCLGPTSGDGSYMELVWGSL